MTLQLQVMINHVIYILLCLMLRLGWSLQNLPRFVLLGNLITQYDRVTRLPFKYNQTFLQRKTKNVCGVGKGEGMCQNALTHQALLAEI